MSDTILNKICLEILCLKSDLDSSKIDLGFQ